MQRNPLTRLSFRITFLALFHSLFIALAGDYRLEVAARPEDFPPDPKATQRNYLHHQINNSGDILFSAHWSDSNAVRRSAIYAGPPGGVRTVVEGGDPIAEFPGFYFTGGPARVSTGNFPSVTFNAQGEVWFNGFIYGDNRSGDLPFGEGFWEASGGNVELIGAAPGFSDNFNFPFQVIGVPYSGPGRLQWGPGFGGHRMTDQGQVFFTGDIEAYIRNVGRQPVINDGLIVRDETNLLQVITYPGAAVPGSNDWVFKFISLYHVGHENGAFVLDTTLEGTRTNFNLGERKRVFYSGYYGRLSPVYTEKDPPPGLPPLAELLGTDEPFDILATLMGGDGTGNFLINLSASARNRIGGAPLGLWKYDWRANKLVKVFRFPEPLPTPGGPVRLDTNIAVRGKIGNNKTVFVAAFTGLGYTNPTTGLFQENGTNFTLLAAAGMVVPGTNANFILGPNIGSGLVTSDFYANESNAVLFAATFRTNATLGPAFQGMFAWRDGALHSVIRAGQQMSIDGTNRTIRSFGYSALNRVFNDLGMFTANVFFSNSTLATIVRASPEAGELPCCESLGGFRPFGQTDGPNSSLRAFADLEFCNLFTFTDDFTSTNWHSPNWDDGRGQPHCDPPGDAAPNTARVVIPGLSDVVLDQRAAPIGSLDSGGHLTLRERLTINKTATATDLVVEGPSGGVILTNGAQMTVDSTIWKRGTLSMADGQIPASFASIDTFLAESGTIEALSGNPVFENYGTFRKEGPEEFVIRVPFNVIKPAGGELTLTEVLAGKLTLSSGGAFEGGNTVSVAEGATLELSGEHLVRGTASFRSNGIVSLGTSDRPIFLRAPSGSAVSFNVKGNTHFYRGELRGGATFVNEGGFTWLGGEIIAGLAGSFENRGDFLIESRPEQRKLNGTFRHRSGALSQFGDIDLSGDGITQADGAIYNNGAWSLFGPCRITGSNGLVILEGIRFTLIDFSLFRSDSKFKVESGLVEVESPFDSQDADVIIGDGATLRLKNVKNIQGTQLYRGIWEIGPGGLLETPGAQIEQVAMGEDSGDGFSDHPTTVIYGGRGWPQFRPNKNEGYIFLSTNLLLRTLENSGLIIVEPIGHLEIEGNLVQFRGGPDAKQGSLDCIAGRLTIGGDCVTSSFSSLGVSREGVVNVGGQLINDNGIVAIGDFFFGGDTDNAAELNVKDTIINQGSILLSRNGILRTQSGFVNDASDASDRLDLEQGAEVIVTGEFLNRGRVVVGGSSTLTLFGSMVNEMGQKGAGNITVTNRGELHVQGDLSLNSPETSLIIRSLGSVVVGGLLTSAGAVRLEQGSIQVGAMRFTDQAALDGNGVMIGNVTTYGLVSPGSSPGALSVVGNVDQTNTSVLVIEVAGTATNQFDRLLVSQTASIGGTLAINVLDGFRPAPSDTFIVLEAGRLTNQFANATNGQRIATFGGFGSFRVTYTPTNVVLSAFEPNPNPTPTAPASLTAPTLRPDSLELKLTGTAGREYLIETSTNLMTWSIAKTNAAGFNGISTIELPASDDSYRFFRARAK